MQFLDFIVYFYRAACSLMQTRYSDENSVCPSVTRVNYDKTEERSVQIFFTIRKII